MLKLPARENTHWKTKLKRVDFLGAVVLVGAVLGLLVGLDRGSNVSWTMPLTIISLSLSAFFFVLFVIVELYVAAEPFAPGRIIFNRTFFSLYCCNFFSFGGWFAALFYIPLYFQAVDGVSASIAGLRLLPSILSGATGSILAGLIMKWTGKYYWLTLAAYSSLTLGCFLIYLSSGAAMTSTIGMILGMVMSAFGNGIGVTSTLIGLSEFYLCHAKSPVTDHFTSIKLNNGGPGSGHRMLIPLPIFGFRNWDFTVVKSGATASPRATSFRST